MCAAGFGYFPVERRSEERDVQLGEGEVVSVRIWSNQLVSMPRVRKSKVSGSSTARIKLRKVVPIVPTMEKEKNQLTEDLTTMGYVGLAGKPWGFKEERVVKELTVKLSNQFDGTMRALPTKWTEDMWREVLLFPVRRARDI